MRGATSRDRADGDIDEVSIHAPHAGRDPTTKGYLCFGCGFQSTRPMRGATLTDEDANSSGGVSIHAPHAGRDSGGKATVTTHDVSIHAPHAGRDVRKQYEGTAQWSFNPRAPCGARLSTLCLFSCRQRFNPRAPCGARPLRTSRTEKDLSFNPRAPCGARHWSTHQFTRKGVSIHAPHAGRDIICRWDNFCSSVSIHAPHAGRDHIQEY